jgi:integrase
MSVFKRTGARGTRWAVKVTVKDEQIWGGTFATQRDAKKEAELLLRARPSDNETCRDFTNRWVTLPHYQRPRAATNTQNRQAVTKFSEDFGDLPLRAVTRKRAMDWAVKHPSRHAAVRAMFNDAMNEDLIPTNPFANLRIRQSRGRRDITALTEGQVAELATTAKRVHGAYGEQYAAMIVFAAYTGLRRGELAVLCWSDIDYANDEIEVSKTLSNDTEVLPPKNGKSRRIVLPPQARDALLAVPRRIGADDRIFSTVRGRRFTKSTFHYAWNPVRNMFGRPDLDWHELRHFTATYLIQDLRLPPSQAAQQLGHSDAGRLLMTLYAHPDEDRMRNEIKAAFAKKPEAPADLNALRTRREAEGPGAK